MNIILKPLLFVKYDALHLNNFEEQQKVSSFDSLI